MADAIFSLNEAQFQKILAALSAQHGWWPVVSVFVSALLAMIVGILLDRARAWFERRKSLREKQEHEIQQINAAISGLTFNIELLSHVASQNILPHYRDSQALNQKIEEDDKNDEHIYHLIISFNKIYPSIFMTCPEMYLLEYDFSKELPFIIERDPEIVKHSGWLVNGVHEIKDVVARRNRNIEDAMRVTSPPEGRQNLDNFKKIIRTQASIAKTECIVASQLFDVMIRLERTLEKINDSYEISAKKSKIRFPDTLQPTIMELKKISDGIPILS